MLHCLFLDDSTRFKYLILICTVLSIEHIKFLVTVLVRQNPYRRLAVSPVRVMIYLSCTYLVETVLAYLFLIVVLQWSLGPTIMLSCRHDVGLPAAVPLGTCA